MYVCVCVCFFVCFFFVFCFFFFCCCFFFVFFFFFFFVFFFFLFFCCYCFVFFVFLLLFFFFFFFVFFVFFLFLSSDAIMPGKYLFGIMDVSYPGHVVPKTIRTQVGRFVPSGLDFRTQSLDDSYPMLDLLFISHT